MQDRKRIKTSIIKMNLSILKYVFRFCPFFVIFTFINIAASVVIALSEVNIIAKAIELVINGSDIQILFDNLIIYAIIIASCTVVKVINRYLGPRYRMIYRKKMQTFLFEKVKHIDMASYDDPEFYDKFSRALGDSTWRGMAVFNTFIDFVESVSISIAIGAYVVITDPMLLVIIFVSAIINVFTINYINKKWYKVYRDSERDRRYQYYVRRTFYQQRFAAEIKTTSIGNLLIEKHDKVTKNIDRINIDAEKKMLLPNFISNFSNCIIQQAGTYIYLAYKLINGLAVATFTATVNATFKFSNNFLRAINVYTSLREHSYYISDFLWITSYQPQIERTSGQMADDFESLKIEDISFRYPNAEKDSISHLSMNLNKYDKIAIVGDNGGGKTTLTKLLLKFYNPSQGHIYYNDVDLTEYNEASIRKQYSIVYQDFQIYALNVAENVLLRKVNGIEDEERVKNALAAVGLLDKVLSLKDGIYTKVTREFDREGATFSSGEAQRLIISRVFASDANIYILDEPTSALDPLSEERINKLIIQNVNKKTMIIIAHRLSTVVDCDKIYLIRNGSIVEEGTHTELMKLGGRYYEMFTTQTELYLKKEKADE